MKKYRKQIKKKKLIPSKKRVQRKKRGVILRTNKEFRVNFCIKSTLKEDHKIKLRNKKVLCNKHGDKSLVKSDGITNDRRGKSVFYKLPSFEKDKQKHIERSFSVFSS